MKKLIPVVLFFLLNTTTAQITINRSDMPNAGDSLKVTTTFVLPGVNYEQTGNNFLWDFTSLGGGAQEDDIFVSVSSTPFIYQAVFNWPVWNPPASIASPENDFTLIPGIAFTNYFDFFKETNAAYSAVGFGVTINGIPVPVKYNNPELLYKFPLTVNSLPDSSESFFALNVPDLGYFETYRKRVNQVDGWGTLVTPFGTFETLRVKSFSIVSDSIFVDSLQAGFPVNRYITEYKWLGNGFGIPLLTVSKEGLLPAQATYLSNAMEPIAIDAGADVTIIQGEETTLSATVTGGAPPYAIAWNHGAFGATVTVSPQITTTYTANVIDVGFNSASDQLTITVQPLVYEQQLMLPSGWSGISSYLIPENSDLTILLQNIHDDFIVLEHLDGVYHPGEGINTLLNWSHENGYFVKMEDSAQLTIFGSYPSEMVLNLTEGWNLIPVMNHCNVSVSYLANQISSELEMIKEVAGTKIFWPSKDIFSLTELKPGKSYLIMMNVPGTLTFPDCE